jgi:hypothetical protein
MNTPAGYWKGRTHSTSKMHVKEEGAFRIMADEEHTCRILLEEEQTCRIRLEEEHTCRILVEEEDLLDLGWEDGDDLAEDCLDLVPGGVPPNHVITSKKYCRKNINNIFRFQKLEILILLYG